MKEEEEEVCMIVFCFGSHIYNKGGYLYKTQLKINCGETTEAMEKEVEAKD